MLSTIYPPEPYSHKIQYGNDITKIIYYSNDITMPDEHKNKKKRILIKPKMTMPKNINV